MSKVDRREIELPDTTFVRDIENRVFQSIVLQCLEKIPDISLVEGSLIDNLLGRGGNERVKGVYVEQDSKRHSVKVKIEVNITYGVSIPEKADDVQAAVIEEITRLTGLHVSSVHVIFKGVVTVEETLQAKIDAATQEALPFAGEEVVLEEAELVEAELDESEIQ